jgi:hypothetical protein
MIKRIHIIKVACKKSLQLVEKLLRGGTQMDIENGESISLTFAFKGSRLTKVRKHDTSELDEQLQNKQGHTFSNGILGIAFGAGT